MRVTVLVAALLVAGCSHGVTERPQQTSTPAPSVSNAPLAAPAAGAPIDQVIAWIEAASPTDAARYHRATREGVTTDLGDDIAFRTPTGTAKCMTDTKHTGGALACLVDLANPPPPPATAYGKWQGGWVDFDGTSLQVGSAHGDPGPFSNGDGPQLPYGQSLSFGDYRCRADEVGLYCVNYAHRSAARFAAAGIEAFGCLKPVPPPEGVGEKFSC